MKLPNQFQMRLNTYPGYTHKVKKNAHGDYEVTWARGFPNKIGSLPCMVWSEGSVVDAVMDCRWEVVDDTPKAEEKQALPDVFYFRVCGVGEVYKMTRQGENYHCTDAIPTDDTFGKHSAEFTSCCVKEGSWVICNKPLTPEQKRANAEYNEQIRALESSIKIAQQSEEHQKRLQENYKSRIEELKAKIVEEV